MLKVGEHADVKVKAAILEEVVALPGVVSVTFEGAFVIVSTRSSAIAVDAVFLADLLAAVKSQGLKGVSLISAASEAEGTRTSPQKSSSSGSKDPVVFSMADEDDSQDEAAAYVDDEEDAGARAAPAPTAGSAGNSTAAGDGKGSAADQLHWSFFAQGHWMKTRLVQEYDDDPTIAARLAKAKQRDEAKRHEEQSRLGRLSSWLGVGR